jgi:hypothetical protein
MHSSSNGYWQPIAEVTTACGGGWRRVTCEEQPTGSSLDIFQLEGNDLSLFAEKNEP